MTQAYSMRSRSILTAILLAVLMAAVCFAFSTAHSYAATGTAVWVTEENSAGQITSVKLDMSSMTGCSQYHVIIKRDDIQILQENVTSSIYDVTDKVLSYDSGIFQAEGFAYKAGAFTEFGTEDLKFFTITIDRQGHGNSFKLNHIKNGTSVKTALKNGYISTFDTGGDERYSAIRIDHNSRCAIPFRHAAAEDCELTVIETVNLF